MHGAELKGKLGTNMKILEKEVAAHSDILVRRIPWTEEPGWATVHGVPRVGHDLATKPPPK